MDQLPLLLILLVLKLAGLFRPCLHSSKPPSRSNAWTSLCLYLHLECPQRNESTDLSPALAGGRCFVGADVRLVRASNILLARDVARLNICLNLKGMFADSSSGPSGISMRYVSTLSSKFFGRYLPVCICISDFPGHLKTLVQ